VVLDPQATHLLARRWQRAETLSAQLFTLIVLGDDRHVRQTVVAGLVRSGRQAQPRPQMA